MELSKKHIWVSNHEINKEVRISMSDFINRISCVETLRTSNQLSFSLYPTSKTECDNNYKIWDYLNKNKNALNDYHYVFNIQFPKELYTFLRYSKRSLVMRPSILCVACLYIENPDKRDLLRSQIYPIIFDRALNLVDKYFSDFVNPDYEEDFNYLNRQKEAYAIAFREFIGNAAILEYVNPFSSNKLLNFNWDPMFREYHIELRYGYMTDSDWDNVVNRGIHDSIERAESDTEPFRVWKEDLWKHHEDISLSFSY